MVSVRRALFFSFLERYSLIAIALLSNILLARLLTPNEIGIYSVSLAVIGIAQVLRDFGIGNFLIQEKNLSDDHIRTAFSFSLLIGCSLFFVLYFAAPFAAKYYAEQQMIRTIRISALNFLTLPFCTISLALLQRELLFKRLGAVNIAASIIGFLTTMSLAYTGYGPNSMAMGAVALNIATGLGAWLATDSHRVLLPGLKEWRSLMKFGVQNSAASIITTISMDVNDLVLGKILGFTPVAMISRAQGLMNLFHRDLMGAIRNVALPSFARGNRDGQAIEPSFIYSVSMVTVLAWPFYGFAALFALEIIRLMFGMQWDEAVGLVPVYCLAGAVAATSNLVATSMLAVGRIDLVSRFEIIFQPIRAGLIIVVGIVYKSLLLCAVAYLAAFILYTVLIYLTKQICLRNNYRSLFFNLWVSFKVTLVTLCLPTIMFLSLKVTYFKVALPPEEFVFTLLIDKSIPANPGYLICAALLALISWFFALIIFKHPVVSDPLFKRLTNKFPIFA